MNADVTVEVGARPESEPERYVARLLGIGQALAEIADREDRPVTALVIDGERELTVTFPGPSGNDRS